MITFDDLETNNQYVCNFDLTFETLKYVICRKIKFAQFSDTIVKKTIPGLQQFLPTRLRARPPIEFVKAVTHVVCLGSKAVKAACSLAGDVQFYALPLFVHSRWIQYGQSGVCVF